VARFRLVQPAHQRQQGNRGAPKKGELELVVCQDSTITPSGLWADVLLPIATHFERHGVALPWYKGHYYIHRPKAIEPLGESKTDFQVFTELAWRLEKLDPALKDFGKRYNPRAERDYFDNPDAVDEAYLDAWWKKVQDHQGVNDVLGGIQAPRHLQVPVRPAAGGLPRTDRAGQAVQDALGQDRDPVDDAGE
jgi:anaerobic selenocysteine-containing dehydrogenase